MQRTIIASRALPAARERAGTAGNPALVKAVRRLLAWIRSERQIRSGIRDLRALDDQILADIGLPRGHIEYAARYGRPTED